MRYTENDIQAAVSAVKQNRLSKAKAAREYGIPFATLHDILSGKSKKRAKGPTRLLTDEEEGSLVNFATYMARQGFPMSRKIIKCYARELILRSGRGIALNKDAGPSDRWFRKLLTRHPELSERTPENQDRARSRMSNQTVIDRWFDFWEGVLDKYELKDKPAQIYNCDETGWSGKEACRAKVVGLKGAHVFSQKVLGTDHITAHLCVSGDGRFLPTMVIFQSAFPHRTFKDGMPGSWLYAKSDTGYMDNNLFHQWFEKCFIPNCGRERPVILVMDNHDSHISLPIVEMARANDIVLIGLPGHTTHILQPLDVKIIGPLKSRFSTLAANLGFVNTSVTISKCIAPCNRTVFASISQKSI